MVVGGQHIRVGLKQSMKWTRFLWIVTIRRGHDHPRVNSWKQPRLLLYPPSWRLDPHPVSVLNPEALCGFRIDLRDGVLLHASKPGDVPVLREKVEGLTKTGG